MERCRKELNEWQQKIDADGDILVCIEDEFSRALTRTRTLIESVSATGLQGHSHDDNAGQRDFWPTFESR